MSTPFVGMIAGMALPSPGCTGRPEALAARVPTVPGITHGRCRALPRRGRRLGLELRVRLEPGTPPDAVPPALRAVTAEAVRAAEPYTAHTRVPLSAAAHRRVRLSAAAHRRPRPHVR